MEILKQVINYISLESTPLFAGGGGNDGEPDHPLGGVLLLKPLHVAAGVVLFHKGAFVVEPFEDDEFAAEVGEFVGGAFGVGEGEFWGRLARLDCGGGREDPTDGQDGKEKVFNHPANIPWNVGWSSGRGAKTAACPKFEIGV